jgi:hypothetical protein
MPGSHNSGFELAERFVDTIRTAPSRAVILNSTQKFCSCNSPAEGSRRAGGGAVSLAAAYFGAKFSVFSS